jgi:hypothetical protein
MTIKNNFFLFLFFYPGWWWWWGVRHVVLCVAYCYVGPAKNGIFFLPSRVASFFGCSQIRVRLPPARLYSNFWRHSTRLAERIDFHLSIDRFLYFSNFFVNSNHLRLLKDDDISFYSLCVCVERRIDRNADFPHPLSSMRSVVMATSYNPLPLPPQHARYTHTHTHNV